MPEVEINDITGIANVGVTEQVATVTVDDEPTPTVVEITVTEEPTVIEVGILGPQGPAGPTGPAGPAGSTTLAALTDVDITNKVDKSILVYNQDQSKFIADDANTLVTLTDGGSF
jgi:hypothetical protein